MTDPIVPEPAQPVTPPPAAPSYGTPAAPAYSTPAYAAAPVAKTNTLAIVGFILSFFVTVAGLVVSIIALRQIKQTGEGGHGLALAGVIIGAVFTAFWIIYIIFVIVLAVTVGAASINSSTY